MTSQHWRALGWFFVLVFGAVVAGRALGPLGLISTWIVAGAGYNLRKDLEGL